MPAPKIVIITGDIAGQEVDVIVNAANSELLLGGGVAGAIRRHGGPSIQDECDAYGPVSVGDAAVTGAGALHARYVIHAASMALGGRTTAESLQSSMDATLRIASATSARTIAIPAVGTGIAGFSLDDCARVMAGCVKRALAGGWEPDEVRFVLYDDAARAAFEAPFQAAFVA